MQDGVARVGLKVAWALFFNCDLAPLSPDSLKEKTAREKTFEKTGKTWQQTDTKRFPGWRGKDTWFSIYVIVSKQSKEGCSGKSCSCVE